MIFAPENKLSRVSNAGYFFRGKSVHSFQYERLNTSLSRSHCGSICTSNFFKKTHLMTSFLTFGTNGRRMRTLPMLRFRTSTVSNLVMGPYFSITFSIVTCMGIAFVRVIEPFDSQQNLSDESNINSFETEPKFFMYMRPAKTDSMVSFHSFFSFSEGHLHRSH